MNETERALVAVLRGEKGALPVDLGTLRFYHFWRHEPRRRAINVAWIKDLRSVQLAQTGYLEGHLEQAAQYLEIDRKRFRKCNAFVAPTTMFAHEVIRWYDVARPHFLFANYPHRQEEVAGPRRNEVVYLDGSTTIFQEELYRGILDLFAALDVHGIKGSLVSPWFHREIEGLSSPPLEKRHQPTVSQNGYDGRGAFGLLINTTNFKQAAECLPRKLLAYLHWGMTPAIDGTFRESIRYCYSHGVVPIIYHTQADLIKALKNPPYQAYDRQRFCIEERIGDLMGYLKSMGAAL